MTENQNPEQKARDRIGALLRQSGWDLLPPGRRPDDEEIVFEARENWRVSKLAIERDKFFKGLAWMRAKGLVPSGKGSFLGQKAAQPKPVEGKR